MSSDSQKGFSLAAGSEGGKKRAVNNTRARKCLEIRFSIRRDNVYVTRENSLNGARGNETAKWQEKIFSAEAEKSRGAQRGRDVKGKSGRRDARDEEGPEGTA